MHHPLDRTRLFATSMTLLIAFSLPAPSAVGAAAEDVAEDAAEGGAARAFGAVPMSFEPNVGQTDGEVAFLARGRGYTVFLTQDEAVFSLALRGDSARPDSTRSKHEPEAPGAEERGPSVVRMRYMGASGSARVVGLDQLPGKSNYLIGDDPSRWHTDVPNYARVRYEGVYDGVDLDFYGNRQDLEYDFRVAPGADPSQVRVRFEGAERVHVDASGELVLRTRDGEVRQQRARVYQEDGMGTRDVPVRYAVTGGGEVGFELGSYDASRTLVIDPVLVYTSFIGGSGYNDRANAIAVDGSGAAYITGTTDSVDFPIVNPPTFPPSSGFTVVNAFVTKLNPAGTALVYSTYLGGGNYDEGTGIAVDATGAAYVAGYTSSTNFPTAIPLQPNHGGGSYDAFLTKLNPAGSALVYSTYLGGTSSDAALAIASDASGAAYLTGRTESPNFPTVNQIPFPGGSGFSVVNAFVTKVNPLGIALVYSSYVGGGNYDEGTGIAVDASGAAYVTGKTYSSNFPTAAPFQVNNSGGSDAFLTKVSAAGGSLVYSSYLGGSADDNGAAVAVDASGAAYVTGATASTNFPLLTPVQATYAGGNTDAFVAKVNGAGAALVYSSYLGGDLSDLGYAITVDGTGAAYVAGGTHSNNFPLANPIQPNNAGHFDAFVTRMSPAGTSLAYSTYYGRSSQDGAAGIAIDGAGAAYIAGWTTTGHFAQDAFVAKLPTCTDTLELSASAYSVGEGGTAIVIVTRSGNCGGTVSVDYATSDVTATAGVDYVAATGTLTIPAGSTAAAFTVQTIDDAAAQGNLTLDVTLSAPSAGAALGTIHAAPITIVDDEAPATGFSFTAETYSVQEGATARIFVVRSSTATAQTVKFTTSDNGSAQAGKDYTSVTQTLRFGVGVKQMTVSIRTTRDRIDEGVETVDLTLSDPSRGATLGEQWTAVLEIDDSSSKK